MAQLHQRLPQRSEDPTQAGAWHPVAEVAKGPLEVPASNDLVATLEGDVAELAVEHRSSHGVGRQGQGLLEHGGRLGVVPLQGQHVTKPFGDLGVQLRHRAAGSLGDAVVGGTCVERMLRPGPHRHLVGVGQGPGQLAGRIEVVGQLEHAARVEALDVLRGLEVELTAVLRLETIEERLPQLVVGEGPDLGAVVDPDDLTVSGVVERRPHHRSIDAGQHGRQTELELLAQHRPGREQPQRGWLEQVEPAGQEEGRPA